jgi:hypothetical protein
MIELRALNGWRLWLKSVGPNKEILRAALAVLQKHAAAEPGLANSIKAQYLFYLANPGFRKDRVQPKYQFAAHLNHLARFVPWERERQVRIVKAAVAGQLRSIRQPLWEIKARMEVYRLSRDSYVRTAAELDLPPATGSGSRLDPGQWGELIHQLSPYNEGISLSPFTSASSCGFNLNATLIVTALALYQAEHGKPPDQQEALVPGYLKSLVLNPISGKPFGYFVATAGEPDPSTSDEFSPKLVPGQAVIWSDETYLVFWNVNQKRNHYFPVPVWGK